MAAVPQYDLENSGNGVGGSVEALYVVHRTGPSRQDISPCADIPAKTFQATIAVWGASREEVPSWQVSNHIPRPNAAELPLNFP